MDYKMILNFNSNNNNLEMSRDSCFKILSIDGLESSTYTINKINSSQDGMTITSKKIEPREITICGEINKDKNENINRYKLIKFFNPKCSGELKVNRNGMEKKIQYEISSFLFSQKSLSDWINFEINLECIDPFFYSIDNFGKNIAAITKQFTFPLNIVKSKGKIMGYKTYKNECELFNYGDVENGVEIVFIAKRGSVENPKILLNDKFIEVIVNMKEKDVLKINTNFRKKSVTLNEVNIMNKINRKSIFFNLNVGSNVLRYESSAGYTNIDVNLYFSEKYLGV
ncbi:MAG: phage tail family protein [Clostridia bacterium]